MYTQLSSQCLFQEADMAIAPLIITRSRSEDVDFSHPFMTFGTAILFKKPVTPQASSSALLQPFTLGLWLVIVAMFVLVSVLLYVVSRLTQEPPTGSGGHVELSHERSTAELKNAFWLSLSSLMLQKSQIMPGYVFYESSPKMFNLFNSVFFLSLITSF